MERTLIFSDCHQDWRKAQKLLKNWKGRVISLGDHWDSRRPHLDADVASTTWWVKDFIQNPKHITLLGNHCLNYRLRHKGLLSNGCDGFTPYKYDKINSILSEDDWRKFKFFHAEEGWWFSHSGIVAEWFEHPILGLTEEVIQDALEKAWLKLDAGILDGSECIHASGIARGGRWHKGGIVWSDYSEAEHHPFITQCFGHSYSRKIKITSGLYESRNIKIDTDMNYALVIEENGDLTPINLWKTLPW